jgi:hypothetical protein
VLSNPSLHPQAFASQATDTSYQSLIPTANYISVKSFKELDKDFAHNFISFEYDPPCESDDRNASSEWDIPPPPGISF